MSLEYPCVHHKKGWCYLDPKQPDACVFGPCSAEKHSNGDKIRMMSDEELAKQLVINVDGLAECRLHLSAPTGKMFVLEAEAERVTLNWLRKPAEED